MRSRASNEQDGVATSTLLVPGRGCALLLLLLLPLLLPCVPVGGELAGVAAGRAGLEELHTERFRKPSTINADERLGVRGAARTTTCRKQLVWKRYQSVERVMQGRPSVGVAPLVPLPARGQRGGEATMPPPVACDSLAIIMYCQRPLRRCARRLLRRRCVVRPRPLVCCPTPAPLAARGFPLCIPK
jgi:hypothetical protein